MHPHPGRAVGMPCLQANEEAKALGVQAFTYGHIMIDKSLTEMAAVHLLVLSGDALGWLLCYFHMLQDWERFLSSAESGVVGREAQHNVMLALARLAHCREESAFKAQVGETARGQGRRAGQAGRVGLLKLAAMRANMCSTSQCALWAPTCHTRLPHSCPRCLPFPLDTPMPAAGAVLRCLRCLPRSVRSHEVSMGVAG